jgi:mannosylfructose-phosphate synthase
MSHTTLQPSRIAMVSTHGYVAAVPPLGAADTGGQVVYVIELARQLARIGYEVDIWTRRFEKQPESEPVAEGVRVIRMPCGGPDFIPKERLWEHLPEWSRGALDYIRRHQLSYAFIDSHYWDAGLAAEPLARETGTLHVHTPHSLGLWKERQMKLDYPDDAAHFEERYNFRRRIAEERRLYAETELTVATTRDQFDLITKDYGVPADKVRLIPPGYDDRRFFPVSDASRAAIRRRLGFKGRVILALGRLARNKGYDLLIQAFTLVAKRHPDAILHLAVGGSSLNADEKRLLEELRELAGRGGYADRIVFDSFVAEDDLADYYRAADMFVLCSRYEPFGMTAIEAMACGAPTVVTVHGGLYRMLSFGRHALFADPFDAEDLGITMAKILRHNRLRRRLECLGAERVRSIFTWSGIAQQLTLAVEPQTLPHETPPEEADEPWPDGE